MSERDYSTALYVAVKIIKQFEGCCLLAYPDPASELYKTLSRNNLLKKWMNGVVTLKDLPKDLQKLSASPVTIGWGETQGVKLGDVWTQEEADKRLEKRVEEFLKGVLKACPQLEKESNERIAACVSFAYNIGLSAFAKSSVCKHTQVGDYGQAADAFLKWTKAGGVELAGLVKRRKMEREFYIARSA